MDLTNNKLLSSLHLTSTENLVFFIEYFEKLNIQWRSTAEEFDLPIELTAYEHWIPLEKFSLFIERMSLISDRKMPIAVGNKSADKLLSNALGIFDIEKPFTDFLSSIMMRSNRLSRHVVYWVEKVDGVWCLCHRGSIKPSFPGYVQIEWYRLSGLLRICRHWLGENWTPNNIYMMTTQRQGEQYELFSYGRRYHYGHSFCAIELPISDDFVPCPNIVSSRNHMEEVLLLAESYAHLPNFSADWLASVLGTSRKTLYRHFVVHDTTFKQIKENARFENAKAQLLQTNDNVSEIAYRLGYTDLSNFNRAMKKWSKMTAPQYRRCHQ